MSNLNISKYIEFVSNKRNCRKLFFQYKDKYVSCNFNFDKENIFSDAYLHQYIKTSCPEKDIIANITIILDNYIYPESALYDSYDEQQFILKTDPVYSEDKGNYFLEINDYIIHIWHYPWESISITDKVKLEFTAIVNNEKDILDMFQFGVKRLLARYNRYNSIYTIHASGVSTDDSAFVFIAGGNSGKSTLFLHLVAQGLVPINDDIVFWKVLDGSIYVHGCPTKVKLRKKWDKNILSFENISTLFSKNEVYFTHNKTLLRAIFFPKFGYEKTKIYPIEDTMVLKNILRANISHMPISVDEQVLSDIRKLMALPLFKLEMSNNYEEICKEILNFIGGKNNGMVKKRKT